MYRYSVWKKDRVKFIVTVLQHEHAPVCQEFLKLGAPRCLRGRLWAQILGSSIKTSVWITPTWPTRTYYLILSTHLTDIEHLFSGTTLLGIKTTRVALRYAHRQIDHERRSTNSVQRRSILRVRRCLTSGAFILYIYIVYIIYINIQYKYTYQLHTSWVSEPQSPRPSTPKNRNLPKNQWP